MAVEVNLSPETRQVLEENHLSPLWELEENEFGTEREDLEPDVWEWGNIKEAIDLIERDVPIKDLPPGFRRRVTVPVNPKYPGSISHTIYVGVQTVSPGETAPSHRHGANALRFTIDGHEEMKTVVGGEEFPMKDNDLITTPQWEWHDHTNDSDENVAWLDVLDLPLVFNSLNVGNVFEEHDDERQNVDKPQGYYESQFGTLRSTNASNGDIPGPFEGEREPTPPYRFKWTDCYETLEYAAENNEDAHDPYDGVSMDYVNPATGEKPLFPTFGVRAQMLDGSTEAHKHNSTEIYYVIEGEGATRAGDETLDWSERDIFVVPPNTFHNHEADDEAVLLAFTDRPILESINFYYETSE
ncbi:MAG: cupin domain-containing protein [Halobacteria archaeon]|nr:cupin domain-containing protein [Halobacteria archaeon]